MPIRQQGDLVILDTVDLKRRKANGIACGAVCAVCNLDGGIEIPDLGAPAVTVHAADHVTAYESFLPDERFGPVFIRNIVVRRPTALRHPDFPDIPLAPGTYQIRRRRSFYPRGGSSDPSYRSGEIDEIWPKETPALHALDCYDRGPRDAPNKAAIADALRRQLLAFDLPDRPIHVVKGPLEAYRLLVGRQEDPDWGNCLHERTPPIHQALIGGSPNTASAVHFPPSVSHRLEILASNTVTWEAEGKTGLRDWMALGYDRSVSGGLADIANCVLALIFSYSDQGKAPLFPSDMSHSIVDIQHPAVVSRASLEHAEFRVDRDYLRCVSDSGDQITLRSLDLPFPRTARHLAFIDALWSDLCSSPSSDCAPAANFLDAYLNGLGGVVVTPGRVVAIAQPDLSIAGGELSSTTGPAVRWASGEKQWFIDSEPVPGWIVERPETIMLIDICAANNAFLREVMIERYRGASNTAGFCALVEDHGELLSNSQNYSLHQVLVDANTTDAVKTLTWRSNSVGEKRTAARYYRVQSYTRSVRQADDWTLGFGKLSKTSRFEGMTEERRF